MASPLSDVVRGYRELGSTLLDQWGTHASKVARKLDDGTYDADSAVNDLGACASLTAESWFLVVSEAFDAAAVLGGSQYEPHIVDSEPFFTSLGGATLRLLGPLVNGHRSDELPVSVISFLAAATGQPGASFVLGAGEDQFRLRADASGHRAGAYLGLVEASASAVAATEQVTVLIIVP